jgi:hypothetical protein
MPYIGGFGNHRTYLDDVAAQGYPGIVLTSRWNTRIAERT